MSKNCFIFGALDVEELIKRPTDSDFVIASDKGYLTVKKFGIKPDLTVGDFDSLGSVPETENIIVLPAEKDDTDLNYAIRQGLKQECDAFYFYGTFGGRSDMSLATLQSATWLAKRGKTVYITEPVCTIAVTGKNCFEFSDCVGGKLSVLSLTDSSHILVSGCKYSVHKTEISNSFPLGVSNEITENSAKITVLDGVCALFMTDCINSEF